MPSWVWTDVVLAGSSEALTAFAQHECGDTLLCKWKKPECSPGTDLRKHAYATLGFDGFVCNVDCAFTFMEQRIMGVNQLVLRARFETRWSPPFEFFTRIANEYPKLVIYMKVEHEDDETYPPGYFKVPRTYQPPQPPPPPPPTPIHDSTVDEIATETRDVHISCDA